MVAGLEWHVALGTRGAYFAAAVKSSKEFVRPVHAVVRLTGLCGTGTNQIQAKRSTISRIFLAQDS
jgi:hypothetical protein